MGRVIRVEDAIRCCQGAEARLNGDITRIIGQFLAALLQGAESGGAIAYTEDPEYGIQLHVIPAQDEASYGAAPIGILGPGVTAGAALFAQLLERTVGTQAPGVVTVADDFLRLIQGPIRTPRPVPSPGLAARAGAGTAGTALGIGAVVLITALELASIASTTGALQAVTALAGAIGQATGKRNPYHCHECMERGALSQAAPRRRMVARILRRV